MMDILKTMKIIYLKNRFKLTFAFLLFLVAIYSSTKVSISRVENDVIEDLLFLEQPDLFEDYYQADLYETIQKEIQARKLKPIHKEDFANYKKVAREEARKENLYWEKVEKEDQQVDSQPYFHGFYGENFLKWDQQGQLMGIDASDSFNMVEMYLIVFILFIGLMLMSFEYLTNYHEFVRALPWRREFTFLGKLIFGLISLGLAFGLGLITFYLSIKQTSLGDLLYFGNLPKLLKDYAVINWTLLTLILLAGSLAGNFLGQIGSFLLMGLFYPVLLFNSYAWEEVLGNRWNFSDSLEKLFYRLPTFLQNLSSLFFDGMSRHSFISAEERSIHLVHLLIFSLLYLGLALLCVRRLDGSRIQQMIQSKPVHFFIKWMAIVTAASGLFMLIFSFASLPVLANLLAYAFFLFLSKLVMDRFFEVKIGL